MDPNLKSTKVGLFVLVGLVLIAAMLVNFSKGANWFHSYYRIHVISRNVAGLKPGASVLLAGVPIGSVESTTLGVEATNVTIVLRIFSRFSVHGDARFGIEQSGFLGDQFIGITPTKNALPMLDDGATVTAEPPFDILEAARSAMGLLGRLETTVDKVNASVGRIDKELLNDQVLTNLAAAVINTKRISERADQVVARLDNLIATNEPVISDAIHQARETVANLNGTITNLQSTINGMRPELLTIVSNSAGASADLKGLLGGIQAGEGVAGGLFKDPTMRAKVDTMLTDLGTLSSNLSRFGILYKPHTPHASNSVPPGPRPRWMGQ